MRFIFLGIAIVLTKGIEQFLIAEFFICRPWGEVLRALETHRKSISASHGKVVGKVKNIFQASSYTKGLLMKTKQYNEQPTIVLSAHPYYAIWRIHLTMTKIYSIAVSSVRQPTKTILSWMYILNRVSLSGASTSIKHIKCLPFERLMQQNASLRGCF